MIPIPQGVPITSTDLLHTEPLPLQCNPKPMVRRLPRKWTLYLPKQLTVATWLSETLHGGVSFVL